MLRQSVVHLSLTDIRSDSRILKELGSLQDSLPHVALTAIGIKLLAEEAPNVERNLRILTVHPIQAVRSVPFLGKHLYRAAAYFHYVVFALLVILRERPALVHCHDTPPLPLGWLAKLFLRCTLVYDAHELESERNGIGSVVRFLTRAVERVAMGSVDHFITVSDSIRAWYTERFPVLEGKSSVIRNVPVLGPMAESRNREASGDLGRFRVNFLYLGFLAEGRGILELMSAFSAPELSDRSLTFVGFGPLEERIRAASSRQGNIFLRPPVRHDEVVHTAKDFDVGVCFLEPVSLSDVYSLPNKLFEYYLAGIPVLASEFPDINGFVEKQESGWVTKVTPEDLRTRLVGLSSEEVARKKVSMAARGTDLSWDGEVAGLIEYYRTKTA